MIPKDNCKKCGEYFSGCICQNEPKVSKSALARGYGANPPREYQLDKPEELQRLYRELAGYMKTCRNCGGDFEGRQFAREALDKLREAP